MKKNLGTKKIGVAAMLLFIAVGSFKASATSQSDQIAYQIGKLQLPPTNSAAAFLKQGQLAIATTSANQSTKIYVLGAVMPSVTSSTYQNQYFNAVTSVLTNPVTLTIPRTVVTLSNLTTTAVTGTLSTTTITPNSVLQTALVFAPYNAPGWVSNAVASSLTSAWGKNTTAATQTANAASAAATALTAAAKLNTANTPTGLTNQNGVANAASAVTANAFNGLRAYGDNLSTNNLTTNNIAKIATSLVKVAIGIQNKSTQGFPNGALGAEGLASATQLSGGYLNLADNIGNTSSLLNALVTGAGKSLGKVQGNITAFTYGLSQGLVANYLYTANIAGGDATTAGAANYKEANTATIVNYVLKATGLLSNSTYQASLTTTVNSAINTMAGAYSNFKSGTSAATAYSLIDGAKGINYFGLLNGVGTPVTDTVGL